MLKHLLTSRATILNEQNTGTETRYGDDQRLYVDTTHKLWKCRVDPMKDQEYEVNRDTRRSWFHLFLTEKAYGHINALSRVVVDGVTYQVFGEPKVYRRRKNISHLEVVLRVIDG